MNYKKKKDVKKEQKANEFFVYGRNVVLELLEFGVHFKEIIIEENKNSKKIFMDIQKLIKKNNLKETNVKIVDRDSFKIYGDRTQGIVGIKKEYRYYSVNEIIENIKDRSFGGFILILDKIEDPNNFGAIIRSSEIFGVDGIIIPEHGSCKVNDAVYKTSVGSVEKIKIARVKNINYVIDDLKEKGYWIYASVMDGKEDIQNIDFTGNICLIVGNEGKGISHLTKEKADFTFKIPMTGSTESLNASVSAGIMCYEVQKNRLNKKKM